jgi:hypothetical protein
VARDKQGVNVYSECISLMVLFDVTLWRGIESSAPFFKVGGTHKAQQGERRLQVLLNKIVNLRFLYKTKNFNTNTVIVSPSSPSPLSPSLEGRQRVASKLTQSIQFWNFDWGTCIDWSSFSFSSLPLSRNQNATSNYITTSHFHILFKDFFTQVFIIRRYGEGILYNCLCAYSTYPLCASRL